MSNSNDIGTFHAESLTLFDLPIIGTVTLYANADGLTRLDFVNSAEKTVPLQRFRSSLLRTAAEQVEAYLAGELTRFDIPIDWQVVRGFHREALQLCFEIPYGQTRTYGDLALTLGKPSATARAVGTAMSTNPIPVIVPCHRVVGKDGKLQGYSGPRGIETKAALLHLEGARILP